MSGFFRSFRNVVDDWNLPIIPELHRSMVVYGTYGNVQRSLDGGPKKHRKGLNPFRLSRTVSSSPLRVVVRQYEKKLEKHSLTRKNVRTAKAGDEARIVSLLMMGILNILIGTCRKIELFLSHCDILYLANRTRLKNDTRKPRAFSSS